MNVTIATLYVSPFYPLASHLLRVAAQTYHSLHNVSVNVAALPLSLEQDALRMEAPLSLLEAILSQQPDTVALSAYTWNITPLLRLASTIKSLYPRTYIVLGGPEAGDSTHARTLLNNHDYIDYIIVGEGEHTFPRLLDSLLNHNDPSTIPNVLSRRPLSNLPHPLPTSSLLSIPSAHDSTWRALHPHSTIFLLETYRGCSNKCSYCSWSTGSTRLFSLERVERELRTAAAVGCNQIYIIDPYLGANKTHTESLLDLFYTYRHHYTFSAFVRPNDINELFLERAREIGIIPMNTGVQACSPAGAKTARRKVPLKKLRKNLGLMNAHGFRSRSIDVIYGIPGDTLADLTSMVDRLADFPVDEINLHRLMVLPGTDLRSLTPDTLAYTPHPPYSVLRTVSMTEADLKCAKLLHLGADWAQRFFPVSTRCLREYCGWPLSTTWLNLGESLAQEAAIGPDFDPFDWIRKVTGLRNDLFYSARDAFSRLIGASPLTTHQSTLLYDLSRYESFSILSQQLASLSGRNQYHFHGTHSVRPSYKLGPFHETFSYDVLNITSPPSPNNVPPDHLPLPSPSKFDVTIDSGGTISMVPTPSLRGAAH